MSKYWKLCWMVRLSLITYVCFHISIIKILCLFNRYSSRFPRDHTWLIHNLVLSIKRSSMNESSKDSYAASWKTSNTRTWSNALLGIVSWVITSDLPWPARLSQGLGKELRYRSEIHDAASVRVAAEPIIDSSGITFQMLENSAELNFQLSINSFTGFT